MFTEMPARQFSYRMMDFQVSLYFPVWFFTLTTMLCSGLASGLLVRKEAVSRADLSLVFYPRTLVSRAGGSQVSPPEFASANTGIFACHALSSSLPVLGS